MAPETFVQEEQLRTPLPAMKPQFSARSLFVLTTAVAVACAIGLAALWTWAQAILAGAVATVFAILLTGVVIHGVYGLGDIVRRVRRKR